MSQSRPQRNTRFNSRTPGFGHGDDWQQNLQPSQQQLQQQQRQRQQQQQPTQRYNNPSPPPDNRPVIATVGVNFLPASQPQQAPMPEPPMPPQLSDDTQESAMDTLQSENGFQDEGEDGKKPWKKGKGVVKLSTRERRRRQNKRLSRVLIPKNALMVLNELNKGEANFTVEQVTNGAAPFIGDNRTSNSQFVATLTADGNEYKGFALSKGLARNDAAEQAIRDWMLKRMDKLSKAVNAAPDESIKQESGNEGDTSMDTGDGTGEEDEEDDMPILNLASFALHKLFLEWQAEGFKIPNFNKIGTPVAPPPPSISGSEGAAAAPPKKKPVLPADPGRMHPCMLLSQMHPGLEYVELPPEGEKPSVVFVFSVTIEGSTYVGKASNKKEARKIAARSACEDIHGVVYAV